MIGTGHLPPVNNKIQVRKVFKIFSDYRAESSPDLILNLVGTKLEILINLARISSLTFSDD